MPSVTDDWKEIGAKWSDLIWIKINRHNRTAPPSYWYAIVHFWGVFWMRVVRKKKFDKECWRRREPTPEKFPSLVGRNRHFECKTVTNLLIEWTGPTVLERKKKRWRKSVNKHIDVRSRRRSGAHNGTSTKRVGNLWFFWAFPLSNHKPNSWRKKTNNKNIPLVEKKNCIFVEPSFVFWLGRCNIFLYSARKCVRRRVVLLGAKLKHFALQIAIDYNTITRTYTSITRSNALASTYQFEQQDINSIERRRIMFLKSTINGTPFFVCSCS